MNDNKSYSTEEIMSRIPNYKYDYNICTVADKDIYERQCKALEKYIPGLIKVEELIDVDWSRYMIYHKDGMQLSVKLDYEVDAVYIESEFNIDPYFEEYNRQRETEENK